MLCTSLCTIINSFIIQRGGNIRRSVGGAVLQNSKIAMYITVNYHQSARRSRRGDCCATHTTVYFLLSLINERGARCAVVEGLRTVMYVLLISPWSKFEQTGANSEYLRQSETPANSWGKFGANLEQIWSTGPH
jgi:hypothetical protein